MWTKLSLGITIRNHLKDRLRNQKQPNHFSRPLILNVFTSYKLFFSHVYNLSIACTNIWFEVYFGILFF